MPIILLWNIAAAQYTAQVGRWLDEIARSTLLLEIWLRKRIDEAERLDRMSARFPVFRFYNTALTARVTDVQFGALLTQSVMGVGSHLERSLGQWDIPRDVRNQAGSAKLPSDALRVVEEMADAILDSLRLFQKPEAKMFNPRDRTATDLIGLAAMAFRLIGSNRDRLFEAAKNLHGILTGASRSVRTDASGSGNAAVAAPPAPLTLVMRIEELSRNVGGALLVIPALSEMFQRIGVDALTVLRYRLLEELERIEALAYGYRRRLFIALRNGISVFAEAGLQLLARIGGFAAGYFSAFTKIGVAFLQGVTDGVRIFVGQLDKFWRGVKDMIDKLVAFGDAVVAIDVGETLHLALVTIEDAIDFIDFNFYAVDESPTPYNAPDQFPVTVREFIMREGAGVRATEQLNLGVLRLTQAVRGASMTMSSALLYKIKGVHIHNIVTSLNMITKALALPIAPTPSQATLKLDTTGGPDLVAEVITPLRHGLSRAVSDLGNAAEDGVDQIIVAAATALDKTARTFSEASTAAASKRPTALIGQLSGNTDALLETLFGDQKKKSEETGLEPVAAAFESWLLQGGFDTVGRAASGYILFMLDQWLVHVAENRDTPVEVNATSPKRLLERAELGWVHIPTLRIVASGNTLSRPLADRVVNEFETAVIGAYQAGLTRLGEFRAVPR